MKTEEMSRQDAVAVLYDAVRDCGYLMPREWQERHMALLRQAVNVIAHDRE